MSKQMPSRNRWALALVSAILGWICGFSVARAPDAAVRLAVPFVAQQADRDCGPTSLWILLRWAAHPFRRRDLATLGSPRLGVLPVQVETWLREHRIPYQQLPGQWPELRRQIDRGVPVMVLWNRSRGRVRNYHYVVVVGYRATREGAEVLVHDGRQAYRPVPWTRFQTWWERARFWNVYLIQESSVR